MRVVLFDPLASGHHAEYATYIARYLIGCGDDVSLVTWSSDPRTSAVFDTEPSLNVLYVGDDRKFGGGVVRRTWGFYIAFRRCLRVARQTNADVVHHLYMDTSELPTLAAGFGKISRLKVFATIFWLHFRHAGRGGNPLRRVYSWARKSAIGRQLRSGRLAAIFVHSEATKGQLAGLYGRELADARVEVVPDPAPESSILSSEQARAALGLPLDEPLLLFFGNLRHNKGPDLFARALASVPGEWVAVIAGEPQEVTAEEIEEAGRGLIENGKLITRIRFIPEADMENYFAAADALVLPYRKTFLGTSGILQRASAAATPVIATDVGDVGEAVRGRGLGLVVEPEDPDALADAIQTFLAERKAITRDVELRAREYADESSWRVLGHKVRDAYLSRLPPDVTSPPRTTADVYDSASRRKRSD